MPEADVTVTFMEITSPPAPRPAPPHDPGDRLLHITACPPSFYRDLYRGVGQNYNWFGRYHWTDAEIATHLRNPAVSFHVLYHDGATAGFAELERHPEDDSVELKYLGLLPQFTGRGLGDTLLAAALDRAFATRPARVWLHTCTLDHPAALPMYARHGFRVYKTGQGREPLLEP
jgi:ribosomal protein S18 acetylase RimI-like enzyme